MAWSKKNAAEASDQDSRDVADELVDAFLADEVVTSAAFDMELLLRQLPCVSVEGLSELVIDLQYSSSLVWSVGNKAGATNQQLLDVWMRVYVCVRGCVGARARVQMCVRALTRFWRNPE